MTSNTRSVSLIEWETLTPANCKDLKGFFLDGSLGVRNTIEQLAQSNLLGITELRQGLQVEAYSHVGRLRIGDLCLSIFPKFRGDSLLRLIRYAYGFRHLHIVSESNHFVDQCGFEDLLISQLNSEVQDLIHRGLLRSYVPQREHLGSPRGRIDINQLAKDGGIVSATIPCIHHPRITDTLLNRVLLGGLKIAAEMASVIELRRESRKLVSMMQEQVSTISLDATVLDRAMRQMNRLTVAYDSAFAIIRLLLEAKGISLQGRMTQYKLPGFLFDMNAFFQALLSRFLRENLEGHTVRDEYSLKEMMKYNTDFNPQKKHPPTPRPDYVIMDRGKIKVVLDAKYRDLWQKPIPREMLYQLVVYAISHSKNPRSTILYPTTDDSAKEARIDVADIIHGSHIGQVCIRPVNLSQLLELIMDTTVRGRKERRIFASKLAFGEDQKRFLLK